MRMARAAVVFDGECALCNGFVAWLVVRDRAGTFLNAGSAGEAGGAALDAAGAKTNPRIKLAGIPARNDLCVVLDDYLAAKLSRYPAALFPTIDQARQWAMA